MHLTIHLLRWYQSKRTTKLILKNCAPERVFRQSLILNADRFNLILPERHGMTYGYCRISTRKQNIERQIRNILRRRSHCRESTASYGDWLLKKMESLNSGRGTPKQKAQVVQELRQKYPLKPLLQLAKLPRSTFYYYCISLKSQRDIRWQKRNSLQSSIRTRNGMDTAELRKS